MKDQITYLIPGAGVEVPVPSAAVRHGQPVSDYAAGLFVDAAIRAGAPVAERLRDLRRMRELNPEDLEEARSAPPGSAVPAWTTDPQPQVWVEPWDGPEPFPVLVAVGGDLVADFYPCIEDREGQC